MDWTNEQYVRVYTRDTVDIVMMPWQSRNALWELFRKCDRAGVIDLGAHQPARGLAALLRMPIDVTTACLDDWLADGCVQLRELDRKRFLIAPNFIEAQEASSSDRARAKASRERKRDKMRLAKIETDGVPFEPQTEEHHPQSPTNHVTDCDDSVTERDGTVTDCDGVTERDGTVTGCDDGVTDCDETVTPCHSASHAVTPCHAMSLYATLPTLRNATPRCAAIRRARAPARDPLVSDENPFEQSGSAGEPATNSPQAKEVFAELQLHPSLARVTTMALAEQAVVNMAHAGGGVTDVLTAIRDLAGDAGTAEAAGKRWSDAHLEDRFGRYTRRRTSRSESGPAVGNKPNELSAEEEAERQRTSRRLWKESPEHQQLVADGKKYGV